MAIDVQGRNRLFQQQQLRGGVGGFLNAVEEYTQIKKETKDLQENISVSNRGILSLLEKLGKALVRVYDRIPQQTVLPKVFPIKGDVRVTNLPDIKVSNFPDQTNNFKALSLQIKQLTEAISFASKTPVTQGAISLKESQALLDGLAKLDQRLFEVQKAIALTPKQTLPEIKIPKAKDIKIDLQPVIDAINAIPGGSSNEDVISKLVDIEEGIMALYNRPQMTPQPVTNMSINALQGTFHATTLNVGTSPTALPATALANRRSFLIYNNSSNPVYLGDIDVATAGTGQGLTIAATSFSPSFQAGSQMTIYGIASSPSSVTVLEISDNSIGR